MSWTVFPTTHHPVEGGCMNKRGSFLATPALEVRGTVVFTAAPKNQNGNTMTSVAAGTA